MGTERATYYARAIEIGVLATALLTPLLFLPPPLPAYDLTYPKTVFFGLVILVLAALWALESAAAGRLVWVRTPLDWPVALFVLWNLVSLMWSRYDYATLSQVGKYAGGALLFYLIPTHFRTWPQLRRLLLAIFAAAALTSAYGVVQFFGYDWMDWQSGDVRVVATLGNATFFAAHLVLLIPLGLNMFLGSPSPRNRVLWALLLGLMYFSLLGTYTRAAWLSLLLVVVLNVVLLVRGEGAGRKPRQGTIRAALLLGVFLLALTALAAWRGPYSLRERAASTFQVDLSNVQRSMAWRAALDIFRAHPLLGTGAGTFFQEAPPHLDPEYYNIGQAQWVAHAHSELLQQAAETGFVGLGLFAWLILVFIAMSGRIALRAPQHLDRLLAAGVLCGVLAFLGQNLAGVSLRWPTGAAYFWLMLGLAAAVAVRKPCAAPAADDDTPAEGIREAGAPETRSNSALEAILAVVLLAVVAFGVMELVKRQLSDIRLGAAIGHLEARHHEQAYLESQQAMTLNPYNLHAYSTLGAVGVETGNHELARQAFETLQSLAPHFPMSHRGLGEAYLGLQRYPEALAAFEADARLEHSPVSLIALARAYARADRLPEARRAAEEAVRIVEEGRPWLHLAPAEAHLTRAQILGALHERQAALQDVEKAKGLNPRSEQPYLVAGDLYRGWGEYALALHEYEQARKLNPDSPQPHVLMGLTYAAQGKWELAIEAYRAALALQPGDFFVERKLQEAQAHR